MVAVLSGSARGALNASRPMTQGQFDAHLDTIVLDVDNFWKAAFRASGYRYRTPEVAIVDRRQYVTEPCDHGKRVPGSLQNAFWCARDDNVYLFSSFLQRVVYRRSGWFGVEYVLAHEWGHHIQNELGYWGIVRRRHIPTIKTETQADCFAGIWAGSAFDNGILGQVDVRAMIAVTDLVGDAAGTPSNAAGAHGRSGLRYEWWKNGFVYETVSHCRTF